MITIHLDPSQSITEALSKLAFDEEITIMLSPGIYEEKLRIYHSNLVLKGTSRDDTVISYGDYARKIHADGKEYNTFRTPTVTVLGNNVMITDLSIRNPAGYGPSIGQALALSLYGDLITVRDCNLLGFQDTLFCGPLPVDLTERYLGFLPREELHTNRTRHHFLNCRIEGHVDFIFGSAEALFEDCEIVSLMPGFIAAPSTYATSDLGFLFWNCRFISLPKTGKVFLARPWREHGCAAFYECSFEGLFAEERFDRWEKSEYRFYEHPYVYSSMSRDLPKESFGKMKNRLASAFTGRITL